MPNWCVQPLQSEGDIGKRVAALFVLVNPTSRHLRSAECNAAKQALRVFAAGLRRIHDRS